PIVSRDWSSDVCSSDLGFGEVVAPDLNKLVDFEKSLRDYAVKFKPLSPSGWQGRWMITGVLFDPDLPIKDYSEEKLQLLLYGPQIGRASCRYRMVLSDG